ncbi:hypothetical protein C7441_11060 [Pseudaminobacter salicylatoxidans]|uniref:Uncharacterized protein n=1 Tax=Pseudaminobacter salicylatoxidans TaxID=93369 RepID=A0A316C5A7_PSESE|nr:hypothetical protein [Pseudaminobacter salicylatoxidans]PWJ81528.1 hypothetical protein C7441_11060 [Pseudaminobacter salicylatoxidans]
MTIKTGFDEAIADARNPDHRNYSPALAKRIGAERRLCRALVGACIERGYAVSVNDGEEWVVKRSTDKAQIMAALFSTDEDQIVIRDKDGTRAGWFQLIYGNDGWDVVSDFSANPVCEAIWEEVLRPLSEKIEEGR